MLPFKNMYLNYSKPCLVIYGIKLRRFLTTFVPVFYTCV